MRPKAGVKLPARPLKTGQAGRGFPGKKFRSYCAPSCLPCTALGSRQGEDPASKAGLAGPVPTMKKIEVLAILFSIFLAGCFASTRSSKLRADPDGFRDVKWGTEISTLKDMEKVESDRSSDTDLVWYMRKGDSLTIGRAKLKNIFYSFWMGTFKGVWIEFEGDENFETLKGELFERFGKVLESEELVKAMEREAGREPSTIKHAEQFYAWWGKNMEMTLSYSKARHQGTLSINSKKISEERRAYEKQKRK